MLWVTFKFPQVKLLAELSSQSLVEQHIGDHSPPGQRDAAQHQAQRHVDQQLCRVVGAGDQLEAASVGNAVVQGLHCG